MTIEKKTLTILPKDTTLDPKEAEKINLELCKNNGFRTPRIGIVLRDLKIPTRGHLIPEGAFVSFGIRDSNVHRIEYNSSYLEVPTSYIRQVGDNGAITDEQIKNP